MTQHASAPMRPCPRLRSETLACSGSGPPPVGFTKKKYWGRVLPPCQSLAATSPLPSVSHYKMHAFENMVLLLPLTLFCGATWPVFSLLKGYSELIAHHDQDNTHRRPASSAPILCDWKPLSNRPASECRIHTDSATRYRAAQGNLGACHPGTF